MEVTIGKEACNATSEKVKDHFSDSKKTMNCPIKDVLDRVGDKWSMYTVIALGSTEKLRFSELMRNIEGISQRMLTVTLRSLEQDGFLTRTIYPEIPPRVEYQLTDLGRSLLSQLMQFSDWATKNMTHIFQAREQYRKEKQ